MPPTIRSTVATLAHALRVWTNPKSRNVIPSSLSTSRANGHVALNPGVLRPPVNPCDLLIQPIPPRRIALQIDCIEIFIALAKSKRSAVGHTRRVPPNTGEPSGRTNSQRDIPFPDNDIRIELISATATSCVPVTRTELSRPPRSSKRRVTAMTVIGSMNAANTNATKPKTTAVVL